MLMGYKAAFQLFDLASKAGLLGDSMVRDLLRTICVFDDPELERDAELYIGYHALERAFSGYRQR